MTSAVIIILREVLEAMLIICILLAASTSLGIAKRWVGLAMLLGLVGAGINTYFFDYISEAFEGVGQEIVNASMLFAIFLFLALFNFLIMSHIKTSGFSLPRWTGCIALIGSIALAITREGVEIYLYLSGYLGSAESLLPILLGGTLGAGIGLSVGALIYYLLRELASPGKLYMSCTVLVLVGSGMVSQAVTFLMQADILPSQLPLWDTSTLLPESSVVGELLYALFSYEATPTPLQVLIYLGSMALMITGMFLIAYISGKASMDRVKHA